MKTAGNKVTSARAIVAVAVAFFVAGCAAIAPVEPTVLHPLEGRDLTDLIKNSSRDRLSDPFIRDGLTALEHGDYITAQTKFNRALKFDPTDSHLHFLNGLTYHLRAATGDSSQIPFAAIGYRLALQYDAANYWAAYQLGHINFNDQLYRQAQDAFAYGLLFEPNEPVLLKALATASYYAQDMETALEAVSKVAKIAPNDTDVIRLAALVNAAVAQFDKADLFLTSYQTQDAAHADHVSKRITDWRNFYNRNGTVLLAQYNSTINVEAEGTDVLGSDASGGGVLAGDVEPGQDGDNTDSAGTASTDTGSTASERMVLVDVVIIRSEERRATNKGVNLLNGLSAALAGTTFTFSDTRTINRAAANARSTVFTYAPTLSLSATYALNIFNDNNERNEVLARPSLVALDGEPSDFFTGSIYYVEISSGLDTDGTLIDMPVGIKLTVTPKFINDKTLKMEVLAARAFIEGQSTQVGFSKYAQVAKTLVTANVAMKFGDTLVISGLTEKESQNLKDGVPLLQSIPIIQYLFSKATTLDYTKSVLILLTPREPRYTYEDGSTKVDLANPPDTDLAQPNLNELKGRPDWFKPAANLDAVFHHLKDRQLFKEFRTGDVRLESWEKQDTLFREIKQAVEFLYY